MENLNQLEVALFESLAVQYPGIKHHISKLKVTRRELTGVGMYIHFSRTGNDDKITIPEFVISTSSTIMMPSLKYGLGWEVSITDGEIDIMELVTYSPESWDGTIEEFTLRPFITTEELTSAYQYVLNDTSVGKH